LALIASLLLVQTALILLALFGRRKRARLVVELRRLSGRLINAQEEERKRIARELHDGVTQLLAIHSIELDRFGASNVSPAQQEEFRRLAANAAEIATEVHNIAHRLHPSKLSHLGLLPAVRELCRDVTLHQDVEVELTEEGVPAQLETEVSLCLYRVVQEALANVARHSGAKHALVSLQRTGDHITLAVADDGQGFDPAGMSGRGIGLCGMRERLRLVNGGLNVISKPGCGAEIKVTVPFRAA
jgi:signal transduction histidine kinase